jgi:hypothetical protein
MLFIALTALPCLLREASGAGGFSGGTFRGGGGYVQTPRGGTVATTPWGGTAVRAPDGAEAVRAPDGAIAVRTPGGGVVYRGPGGGVVADLPVGAVPVVVGDQSLYVSDGVYYEPCFVGNELSYCVTDFAQ